MENHDGPIRLLTHLEAHLGQFHGNGYDENYRVLLNTKSHNVVVHFYHDVAATMVLSGLLAIPDGCKMQLHAISKTDKGLDFIYTKVEYEKSMADAWREQQRKA